LVKDNQFFKQWLANYKITELGTAGLLPIFYRLLALKQKTLQQRIKDFEKR
jgi:hypothetical protein